MAERTCTRCSKTFDADNGGRGRWSRFCSDECRQAKEPAAPTSCSVLDCQRIARSGSSLYCEAHYYRLRRTGALALKERVSPPTAPPFAGWPTGDAHPSWRGDDIGFSGAHRRVIAQRGPARARICVDCGAPAGHWSYEHTDLHEQHGQDGPYSADPVHYSPRCVSCHKTFDLQHIKGALP